MLLARHGLYSTATIVAVGSKGNALGRTSCHSLSLGRVLHCLTAGHRCHGGYSQRETHLLAGPKTGATDKNTNRVGSNFRRQRSFIASPDLNVVLDLWPQFSPISAVNPMESASCTAPRAKSTPAVSHGSRLFATKKLTEHDVAILSAIRELMNLSTRCMCLKAPHRPRDRRLPTTGAARRDYDSETALNYDYFRAYDPQAGRYVESDPIGLKGGSYSTYGYANGNRSA